MMAKVILISFSFLVLVLAGCDRTHDLNRVGCLDSLEYDFLKAYLVAYERTAIDVYVPDLIQVQKDTFDLGSHGIDLLSEKDKDNVSTVTGGDYMVVDEIDGVIAKVTIYAGKDGILANGYLPVARLIALKYPDNNREKVDFYDMQKRRFRQELQKVKQRHHLTDEQFDLFQYSFIERLLDNSK